MMKNNNHKTRRHCGSSPHFEETEQGLHEWEIGLKSAYQYSDDSPFIQLLDEQVDQEEESDDQESDARQRKGMETGRAMFSETEFRRNQDDGGESG